MLSYYQILQVKETATDAEVKQAYRKLVKILHPDKNDNTEEATIIFRLLNQAYETLSDPLERKEYDRKPELSNDDVPRLESYKLQNAKQARKLKEYEDMLKEYKQSVFVKSERERKLTKEVKDLKKRNLENESALAEMREVEKEMPIPEKVLPQSQSKTNWLRIALLILGVNLAMFLTYFTISRVFGFFF